MVNKRDVNHIAKLARLEIKEEEAEEYQKEFTSILDYFELLKELDVSKTEPTFHPAELFFGKNIGTMREDKEKSSEKNLRKSLRKAFPESKGKYTKVKTVFDNES